MRSSGPKGKIINALQQETGTDIAVDDDGLVGTVTIGAKDGGAVAEARRRIEMILDPPKAEVGQVYTGKVVNITKFGAFVNILPGRDGLVHISKLGRGRRVDKVEDVLDLGDEVEVRVDDIDPQGKVSLSLAGANDSGRDERPPANGAGSAPTTAAAVVVRGQLGSRGEGDLRRSRSGPRRLGRRAGRRRGRPGPAAQSPPAPAVTPTGAPGGAATRR